MIVASRERCLTPDIVVDETGRSANKAIVAMIKGIERRLEIARRTTGFTGSGRLQ